MKRFLTYMSLPVVLIALFTLQSCKDDDGGGTSQTEVERVTELLTAGTWSMESIFVEDTDYTDDFSGLTLSFDGTTMTSNNGRALFDETTTWDFQSDEAMVIVTPQRDITINSISETRFVMEFEVDGDIFGRPEAVGGTNVITFTR